MTDEASLLRVFVSYRALKSQLKTSRVLRDFSSLEGGTVHAFDLSMIRKLVILCFVTTLAAACGYTSLAPKKPENAALNASTTELWASDIRRVAQDGDWILARSYSTVGNAIVGVTRGEDFSHAVIYDARRDMIIEAIRPVVREVSLESFLARNRHVVLIRPAEQDPGKGRLTVQRARTVIGASYDYTGLVGLGTDSRFYCSELVAWASQIPDQSRIVTPAELWELGELIYLSGTREDPQVQAAALAFSSR